jgi:predicted nucleotidyltransferase
MIPQDVQVEILRRLRQAEAEHGVRILLAVESGSRAWGFPSPNSDYDARFIYAHPPEWYLSVGSDDARDVIEYPIVDDIDLNGWDILKALRLFKKSNPAFVEWIQSPIVYVESGPFAAQTRLALPSVYSPTAGLYHYRSMAKTNFRGHLKSEEVPLKKYLYALRPLLSIRWIERERRPAPIVFQELLGLLPETHGLLQSIMRLLEMKRASPELGLAPRIDVINQFIESELERLESIQRVEPESNKMVLEQLDGIFHAALRDAWPGCSVP